MVLLEEVQEEVLTEISMSTHVCLLITFEHISLYIQKHFGQSVALFARVDHRDGKAY